MVESGGNISLISLTFVLEPAAGMSPSRVVVRPMNNAPIRIPFIHPTELHVAPLLNVRYTRRDVDVVSDKQGLPRPKFQDETLMPASIVVVRQHPLDHSLPFNLKVPRALFESALEDLVACRKRAALCIRWVRGAGKKANT